LTFKDRTIYCPECGERWGCWGRGCPECKYMTTRELDCPKNCEGGSPRVGYCIHDPPPYSDVTIFPRNRNGVIM